MKTEIIRSRTRIVFFAAALTAAAAGAAGNEAR